jgi:hypothetical protein
MPKQTFNMAFAKVKTDENQTADSCFVIYG